MSIDEVKGEIVNTWPDFLQLVSRDFSGKWLFRGVLDDWSLKPSLQRAAEDWGTPLSELPDMERRLLREFKRAYPLSADMPRPSEDDDIEWLAIMQHYGAPTRLLDWTYSQFVAAFFALDALLASPYKDKRMAAIWALSIRPFVDAFDKPPFPVLPSQELQDAFLDYARTRNGKAFRAVFVDANPRLLLANPVTPYRLTTRLFVQHGVFICPGDISRTFEDNLLAIPGVTLSTNLRKILLPPSILEDAFDSLNRMNINQYTLFPDMDGYARNWRHRFNFLRNKFKQFRDDTK